jgi:hypothetical protein
MRQQSPFFNNASSECCFSLKEKGQDFPLFRKEGPGEIFPGTTVAISDKIPLNPPFAKGGNFWSHRPSLIATQSLAGQGEG